MTDFIKEQKPYLAPKSMCQCGHNGDGPDSNHEDSLIPGHGACNMPGCDCKKFRWAKFNRAFKEWMKKRP
jgi:hypothetical protein